MVFGFMEIDGIVGPVNLFSEEAKQKYRQQAIDNAIKWGMKKGGFMFKVRYSRLYSLGNFENEKVELERDFLEEISYSKALTYLMAAVDSDHKIRIMIREKDAMLAQAEAQSKWAEEHLGDDPQFSVYKKNVITLKSQIRKLKKKLGE